MKQGVCGVLKRLNVLNLGLKVLNRVMQWVAMSPNSKKVGISVWSLLVRPVFAWVFLECFGFPHKSKDKVQMNWEAKLSLVYVCV